MQCLKTMGQVRLNHLMVLSIYKEELDRLNLMEIANEFVRVKGSIN